VEEIEAKMEDIASKVLLIRMHTKGRALHGICCQGNTNLIDIFYELLFEEPDILLDWILQA
jgi:hypothetical protein